MVFDVTLLLGQNSTLEYDSNGDILEKTIDSNSATYSIPNNKVGKFTVIKDPIVNHINLYAIELFDLPMDIIIGFKANIISAIIVRIGDGYTGEVKNFNLHKIFIRPITLLEQDVQQDKVQNDIIVKGISLTANAILLDSSFGAELEDIRDYQDAQAINMNPADSTIDYTTSAKVSYTDADKQVNQNVRNFNPGNIRKTNINWAGELSTSSAFEKFATPELGFRAMAKNILAKRSAGKTTLSELIAVWAPPTDGNDTSEYIRMVSKYTGVNPGDQYSDADIPNIMRAMSWIEGDNTEKFYTNEMINTGAKMAGLNSTVSSNVDMNNLNYKYGSGTPPITGTNVNRAVNTFSNTKGADLLNAILQRMKEKYNIEVNLSAMMGTLKSNFLYKTISLPGITTLELLKKIHKEYPAYYMEVPWILDDMKGTTDPNSIGKTWYTEIGILNINSLNVKSIWDNGFTKNKSALYSFFHMASQRLYYPENRDRIDASTFVFKELPTGIETIFPAESSMEIASVPDPSATTQNSVGINKLKINTHKTIHTEAAYTAEEFKKRLDLFKKHVYANPQIVKCIIKSDDPNFIEFGYAYTFDQYKLNKITPYKIKMEFHNVNDEFHLTYETDFYKGIDIVQS